MKLLLKMGAGVLVAASGVLAAPPYPPSPVIASIDWAPKETIIRQAKDGDNWPVTWADDDALYTTWGDGTGFLPKTPSKLSLGFARVTGAPENFQGVNVRSSGEQLGQGRAGKKGWGILSVGGVLYLWLGHADNKGGMAQLAWSKDHGQSWAFADWKFAEFGLMGFVNHGKDNAGAPDDFVYAYSHDGALADTPADRFILLRAPKDRIAQRNAWEFWVKTDAAGRPQWSSSIKDRGAVFQHTGACLRSAMTWCAPLRRYLWWQHLPLPPDAKDRGDTRYKGGFAIYDAPHPWGPWTTAFFTPQWDVGPGEHGDFPAKWMSADGLTLHLVFSGDDAFSVRRATVTLRPQAREVGRARSPANWVGLGIAETVAGVHPKNLLMAALWEVDLLLEPRYIRGLPSFCSLTFSPRAPGAAAHLISCSARFRALWPGPFL